MINEYVHDHIDFPYKFILDSSKRDKTIYPDSNNFRQILPFYLRDISIAKVINYSIPVVSEPVDSTNNQFTMTRTIPGAIEENSVVVVTIDRGEYTPEELATFLTTYFADSTNFPLSWPGAGLYTWEADSDGRLTVYYDNTDVTEFTITATSDVLGGESGVTYTSSPGTLPAAQYDALGVQGSILAFPNYPNLIGKDFVMFRFPQFEDKMLKRTNYDGVGPVDIRYLSTGGDMKLTYIVLDKSIDFEYIDIRLENLDGTPYNLKGRDIKVVMEFEKNIPKGLEIRERGFISHLTNNSAYTDLQKRLG